MSEPAVNRLRELFVISDDGRLLYRTARRGVIGAIGSEAGWLRPRGYRAVAINGRKYLTHRVVFAIHYGRWPTGGLDHIDGNPNNNRPSNLREATQQQNVCNARRRVDNTSGKKGVSWDSSRGKWVAQLSFARKHIHLGRFDTFEDAAYIYDQAAVRYHGEFVRLA